MILSKVSHSLRDFWMNEFAMFRNRRRIVARILKCIISCVLIFVIVKLIALVGDENRPMPELDDLKKLLVEGENENSKRLFAVRNTCRKYNLGMYKEINQPAAFKHPPAPQYSVFYITRSHNLSYCPIYKAGSTTWIYNLCLLMNVPEEELNSGKEQISTIARRVVPELEYPEADEYCLDLRTGFLTLPEVYAVPTFLCICCDEREALRVTNKLLVVRHPFDRLLSAYRDKLENSVAGREHGTLHFYRKYGAKIVQKYRGRNFTKPREDQVIRRENGPSPAGNEPTFREFVLYLIHTDLASYGDDHWLPYYLFCTPCTVNYDIIAKVETLWRDQIYTIHKLGLQEVIKPRWRHSSGHSNASRIYFSQLDRGLVERLYEKFQLDFHLFGYSPEIYYRYATSV